MVKKEATPTITKGKITSFKITDKKSSYFALLMCDNSNPTPTDKSPIGKAAALKIAKVFIKTMGKSKELTFKIPPIKQATIKGLVKIDFKNLKNFKSSLLIK